MKKVFYVGPLILLIGSGCDQKPEQPNFLILLTDDQRMDALGCYNENCPIETPNIDRLATEGIRFSNGFVTTPICVVSRASIISGRYECNNQQHQFLAEMPDEVFEHIYPVHLKNAGYFTGQLGKYGVGISQEQMNYFDVFEAQADQGPAFREYKGRKMHDAEWLTVKTREFMDQIPQGKPFCLQVNYKEPHQSSVPAPEDEDFLSNVLFERSPMDTPEEYAKLPKIVKNGFGRVCYFKDYVDEKGDHNPYLRQYFEKIMSVERSVGEIFKMLEEKGVADNTVIVFLSDHGTHFGEKQLSGKWTPYDASLRIPFIIFDPRSKSQKGMVREEIVLNIDLAPTLLDLAGIKVPEVMDGESLVPVINGKKTEWRKHFFFEHYTSPAPVRYIPRNVGVRTESAKYIKWIDFEPYPEEYFDLVSDPREANNLINSEVYKSMVDSHRIIFENWRKNNPMNFDYDPYGKRPQYGAKEINWDRFKEVRPKEYEKIRAEIERMGVTWEDALNDWDIRYEICMKTGYWY